MARLTFNQGFKIIREANKVEALSDDVKLEFSRIWIYPAKGASGGRLTDNVGDVYVGKRGIGDPIASDLLAIGSAPILIELQPGEKIRLNDILVYGAAGDGVFFSYT